MSGETGNTEMTTDSAGATQQTADADGGSVDQVDDKTDAPEADKGNASLGMSLEDTGILNRIEEMLTEHAKAVGEQLDSFVEREIAPLKAQIASIVEKLEQGVTEASNVTVKSASEIVGEIAQRVTKIEGRIRHLV